ncbi:protein WEAK CHLOROPLAST MOVEMENT UNDER BLUE LIGHT-like 1 [Curcuma longa]|uniref:protein WEAK CHLOROPLAST MOVEMENT UNDER BLUE LIGHT-like 1 n=1 Tax=Curcuma longa TaxID=136217 RepID=UPI003D9DC43E
MEGATNLSSYRHHHHHHGDRHGGELEIDDPSNEGVTISRDPFIRPEGAKDGGGMENNDQILSLPTTLANPSTFLKENGLIDAPTRLVYEPKEAETLSQESAKKADDTNRILVDTAAPFESVRAAVSKFGGILDGKAEEASSIEKQKQVLLTLKKVQEEILMYQKRFRDEETAKAQVLEELNCFKQLVEGLNLRLEREETLEKQAKQDFELADLRLREVVQGIADDSSVASKAQLDVANERHTSAVAELKSTKGELESIQAAHVSLIRERDIMAEKAADSVAALEGIEQTIQDLALKLVTAKQLLESAHTAHLEAQEQTLVAALSLDIENLLRDKLLNQAEEELQQVSEQILMTNAMKSELAKVSSLLVHLKGELDSRNQAVSVTNTKGFDEYNSIKCLKLQLSSLQSELEKEKASLSTLREREGLTSTSIAFLEAELNRMNTEFELILNKEWPRDKVTEMEQAKLQQAMKEVEEDIDKLLEEKKKALREAMARIKNAEDERIHMEHELRTYKHEDIAEPKRRKRMFFARIVMFFAGKKVQSLQ